MPLSRLSRNIEIGVPATSATRRARSAAGNISRKSSNGSISLSRISQALPSSLDGAASVCSRSGVVWEPTRSNFARAGADYTGVELSEASLALARKRFELFDLKGTLLQCNAEELDRVAESAAYDLVYSFEVIHHTPDPGAVIRQARRAIRPTGEFRLMLYARNSWKNAMIEAGFDQPEAQSGCPIAFTYTHQEVRDLLGGNGFAASSISQDHIFPYVVEKYVRYEYELQPWFAAMPRDMFRALEQSFGWHMLIAAKPV